MNFAVPRVDVVIPAYNAGDFIEQALESVAAQGPCIASIFVVDDGSTDGTVAIVKAFAERHQNLRIECLSQKNLGPSAARNSGLSLAKSEFVALLDADDVWVPTKIPRQLALFDRPSLPNLGVVYCGYGLLTEHGKPIENEGFKLDTSVRGRITKRLLYANLIAGSASAVLIKRSLLEKVGLFDTTLVCSEDWDLWLRLSEEAAFDYVEDDLVYLRQHSNNSQKNEIRMLGGEILFLDKLFRTGRMRWFHIFRIWRRLILGGIDARKLDGFDRCQPLLRYLLDGVPLRVFRFALKRYLYIRAVARRIILKLRVRGRDGAASIK